MDITYGGNDANTLTNSRGETLTVTDAELSWISEELGAGIIQEPSPGTRVYDNAGDAWVFGEMGLWRCVDVGRIKPRGWEDLKSGFGPIRRYREG